MAEYAIALQIWKDNHTLVKSIQGEAGSRILTVTFLDSTGQPINLTGCTPRMSVNNAAIPVFNDGVIKDFSGGIAQFEITSDMLIKPGEFCCEFLLAGPNFPPLKANGLTLRVDASNSESAVESSNNFSALVIALNSVYPSIAACNAATYDANVATTAANAAANLATKTADILIASLDIDLATGELIMTTPDDYMGLDFALTDDGELEVIMP